MIYARNNIEIVSPEYQEDRYYLLDRGVYAQKLTVNVLSELTEPSEEEKEEGVKPIPIFGPVVIQVTERPEQTFEDELNSSQFLELGFYSKTFVTPITGFRLRTPNEQELPEALPGKVCFVFYG